VNVNQRCSASNLWSAWRTNRYHDLSKVNTSPLLVKKVSMSPRVISLSVTRDGDLVYINVALRVLRRWPIRTKFSRFWSLVNFHLGILIENMRRKKLRVYRYLVQEVILKTVDGKLIEPFERWNRRWEQHQGSMIEAACVMRKVKMTNMTPDGQSRTTCRCIIPRSWLVIGFPNWLLWH